MSDFAEFIKDFLFVVCMTLGVLFAVIWIFAEKIDVARGEQWEGGE